ncbi:glycine zipper family protein [Aequorivita sp. KMM 9714]|nr:glycine zipper family protein [Aequorivita sp. KMM 9714]
MDINKASELLKSLLSQTDKKSEKKVYHCFIHTLSSLKNRDLTETQSQLIEDKLSSLNLNTVTENRKKFYKQKLSEFIAFLKNEFSFTTAKYYTEIWMVYGMIFGTGIGISIGTAIGAGLGTSIGLSIGAGVGMVLGMIIGARKDAEAKRQGKVI